MGREPSGTLLRRSHGRDRAARWSRIAALLLGLCLAGIPNGPIVSSAFSPIRLPADAALHPKSPNEWWYVTGHLRDPAGTHYGFEMVTFKFGNARELDPFLTVNTLYRIDLAITDETHKHFYPTVEYILPSSGTPVLSTHALTLRMTAPPAFLSFTTEPGTGLAYRLSARMPSGSLDLRVTTTRPPLLEGGNGLERIGDGFSYYYSLTNLITTGTLILHGHKLAVSGLSWMDHQWGRWTWTTQKGWDWMAIQLANGTSLSLVNFLSGPRSGAKHATISFAQAPQLFTRDAVMTPLGRRWTSPRSHITYPTSWKIAVPAIGLKAVVTTSVPNQEVVDQVDPFSTYWEGSGRLSGTLRGKPISGLTYTELAGYYKGGT
ncbi:MAG TPA: lipocalin-like domain-containing protein [Chloroflexota bacterium]|nr:lipocalin-like domain-containing protein [Chloroflexota bacterium]